MVDAVKTELAAIRQAKYRTQSHDRARNGVVFHSDFRLDARHDGHGRVILNHFRDDQVA